MKLKIHCKIGKYARPLNIGFNETNKMISAYNDTIEFEFEEAGEYHLSIEQIEDEKLGVVSQIILTIINCFKIMLSLCNLESFNFADYNNIKPFSLKKNYSITLNSNTNIYLSYKDTSFSSVTKEFSIPYVEIENFSVQDEKTKLDCSVNPLKQNKKHLKVILSLIFFICFLFVVPICYTAVLSKSITSICVCSAILLFFIAVYFIELRKIVISYNEIIKKLSIR